jgi:hypothetical protein
MNSLDPSKQLLCQLATGRITPAQRHISASVWQQLLPIAHQEGLAPLLYWTLHNQNWSGSIPEPVHQSLVEMYYASVAHNTLLFTELDKILPVLEQNNISVILVKGASLALSLYPERDLRPMMDVDCLVPWAEHQQALQLLGEMGYQEDARDQVPGLHAMSDYHANLKGGPGNRVIFELHWGLVSSPLAWYAAPIEWFWQHIEPWNADGCARQLTPLAHLLYQSAHAMLQHGGSHILLIWLYDLHLLAQSGLVDWQELVEQAAHLRWGGVVEQALRLTQAAFDTRLPEGLLEQLAQVADPAVDRLVAFKQQFGGVRLLYDWYSLVALRGMPRLRYMLGMIFPRPTYIRWRYQPQPSWLWPFYYPYRWLRMCTEGILAMRRGILRAVR